MTINRKIIISLSASLLVAATIFRITTDNNSKIEDNSYYAENPYTGTLDFVDPDQEPEPFGPALPSFRNSDKLVQLTSVEFSADAGKRISEYVFVINPDETQLFILEDTLTSDENFFSFTVEGGLTKQQYKAEVFETRQGYANVYVDNNGPMNFYKPYYTPPE